MSSRLLEAVETSGEGRDALRTSVGCPVTVDIADVPDKAEAIGRCLPVAAIISRGIGAAWVHDRSLASGRAIRFGLRPHCRTGADGGVQLGDGQGMGKIGAIDEIGPTAGD